MEDILLVDTEFPGLLEIVGENVETELRVGISVDMSMGIGIKELSQSRGVDEVTVLLVSVLLANLQYLFCSTHMGEDDTIR